MDYKSSLAEYGYYLNEGGQIRSIDGNEPFNFAAKDDHHFNQNRYESIGEIVDQMVYQLLEEKCKLQKCPVPIDPAGEEPQTFIFMSPDFMLSSKILVLVHGSGVVRAGQWARRLIINDSLETGTQIPYINRALKEGYGVLIMNTNDNRRSGQSIRGSENPMNHFQYVWKNYIMKTSAKIAIVAHSYGGHCTVQGCAEMAEDFEKRVFAVAMTDSVHSNVPHQIRFLEKISRNWVSSAKPLDAPVEHSHEIPRVSAGTTKHEMTSASSIDSVFDFLQQKLENN